MRQTSFSERIAALARLLRELERQGTTYLQLVERFRIRRAVNLLNRNNNSVEATAYTLGFTDVGRFRRAFHDWTGQPVAEWCSNGARDADVDAAA